jgi:hypothetical protein
LQIFFLVEFNPEFAGDTLKVAKVAGHKLEIPGIPRFVGKHTKIPACRRCKTGVNP